MLPRIDAIMTVFLRLMSVARFRFIAELCIIFMSRLVWLCLANFRF